MAARRGKSQARRNGGNSGGLPGWAWMVLGIVLALGVVLLAPKYLKSDGDGFFRPQPNPDAQPAPVASVEDEVVAPHDRTAAPTKVGKRTEANDDPVAGKDTEFDFYTLLPGKEVPLTDAELAATERAEAQREAQQIQAAAAARATANATPTTALPRPVDTEPGTNAAVAAQPSAAQVASADPAKPAAALIAPEDNTRYLLQAGAFQASGQAEELKAKIALLGLGARVESAAIGGKTVYRVRMGPYGTASDLAEAKRKLASGGLPGMAIKVK